MEIVVVIAGLVALVWGGVLLFRGGLVGCGLAVLLAGCCFGYPFFHLSAGPIPLTADRLLWVVLVGQYVVWRRLGWADPKPRGAAEIVLVAFTAWLLLSTLAHDWQLHNNQPLAWLVFFYLMPVGLYWVVRQSRLSESSMWAVYGSLACFGVYLGVTAIAEANQQEWLVFPKYITLDENAMFLGRGRGPLLNPIGCGLFLSVCLFGTLMGWPRLKPLGRLALLAASSVMLAGVFFTLTRSVWIGTSLGLLLLVGVTLPRSWRLPVLGASVLAAAVLVTAEWEQILSIKRDRDLSAADAAKSVKLRPILATVAWKMFLDRPVVGCGFGQYMEEHVNYLSDRSTELPLEEARPYVQHNVFLALLTETGLPGASLFVLLLVFWLRDAWRLWRSSSAPPWARRQGLLLTATLGSYLTSAMFHEMSLIPMVNMLLFFMAGLTAGLRPLAEPRSRQGDETTGAVCRA